MLLPITFLGDTRKAPRIAATQCATAADSHTEPRLRLPVQLARIICTGRLVDMDEA